MRSFFGLLFVTLPLIVYPSTTLPKVEGFVYDSETHEPIPYAHVSYGSIHTVTNEDGAFSLSFLPVDSIDLRVSFIGYETLRHPITALGQSLQLLLKPAVMELQAVTVMTGEYIIEKVLERLRTNYELGSQYLMCYYKERMRGNEELYYLAEGILDVYQPSHLSGRSPEISPIKTRKREFALLDEEMTMVHGHAGDMLNSIVRRGGSFIQPKNFKDYDFEYTALSEYNGKEVFVLSFQPKTKKGSAQGKIFVDSESYAIIKTEYYPRVTKKGFWEEVSWTEEFNKEGILWNLSRVTYNGKWIYEGIEYRYESLLLVNESKPVKIPPALGLLLEEKDIFFNAASDFTENFWEGYNYMKLNSTEMESF